ncbi:MAG TPA: tripartite tricarboxylate transporter substrate binding protein [Ramlibacter sp.]|nr:tripartite tricarboxylate transporter substrate binding protein [Ramlibacter sp.]
MNKLTSSFAALVLAATASVASAAWPDKPIKLVVPFPPGGGTDVIARLVGQKLSDELGVPVIIDNKPGADTQIGTAAVAKSPADGYTLGMVTPSLAINKSLYASVPYDPIKDFTPISLVAATPFYLAVGSQTPYKSARELVAASQQPGSKFSYGTASSIGYLSGEQMRAATGLEALHIPYKGSAASVTAVAAGDLTYTIDTVLAMRPLVQAGKLRILAVSSPQRARSFPDVPALAEFYKGFQIVSWWGIVAPAGVPAEAVGRLNQSLAKIMAMPDVREKLEALGAEPNYSTAEKFAAVIRDDLVRYEAAVKSTKLEPGR